MDSKKLIAVLRKIGEKIIEQKDFLTELDRPIGDNDHGINMARGFEAVEGKLNDLQEKDIGTILKTAGMTLVSTVGGSSGPLYGTLFMKMGMALKERQEVDFQEFLSALALGIEGVGGQAQPLSVFCNSFSQCFFHEKHLLFISGSIMP